MASEIYAVAEGGLYRAVVDQECRDLHAIRFIDDALLDVMCRDLDSLGLELFVNVTPDVDVERKGLLKAVHHADCSIRAPNLEWNLAGRTICPGSQEKIWNVDHMIRVKMSN